MLLVVHQNAALREHSAALREDNAAVRVPSFAPAASPRVRRRLPSWPPCRRPHPARESPAHPPEATGRAPLPGHIRQVGAGASPERRYTLAHHVHLSVSLGRPRPSGSADPSRRCQGCSHPPRRLPVQAALSFTSLLRQTGDGVLPPPPGNAAPRGARKPKSKPLPVHSRRSAMTPGMPEKQTHDDARHGPQRRRRRQ